MIIDRYHMDGYTQPFIESAKVCLKSICCITSSDMGWRKKLKLNTENINIDLFILKLIEYIYQLQVIAVFTLTLKLFSKITCIYKMITIIITLKCFFFCVYSLMSCKCSST